MIYFFSVMTLYLFFSNNIIKCQLFDSSSEMHSYLDFSIHITNPYLVADQNLATLIYSLVIN